MDDGCTRLINQDEHPNILDWLALSLLPRLGARRLKQWQEERCPWPHGWWAQLSEGQRHYFHYLRHPQGHQQVIQPLLDWCNAAPARALLHPYHADWPRLLNELPDPPPVLWAWGNLACLKQPALAIVGTRHPSSAGRQHAYAFAHAMADAGACIVSGMALGIDGCAHEGALAASGTTIAVVGCGLDHTYPRQHRDLQQHILDAGGLLLSEHPPATPARPAFFPRRNRIITGTAQGVLIVEAALRSGSLISARLALEQNRDVFALPGPLSAAMSAGCHQLIRQGATLVTTPAQILEELGGPWPCTHKALSPEKTNKAVVVEPVVEPDSASLIKGPTENKRPLVKEGASTSVVKRDDVETLQWLKLLSNGVMSLDQLVLRSGRSVSETLEAMLSLELEARVVMRGDGWALSASSSESAAQTR